MKPYYFVEAMRLDPKRGRRYKQAHIQRDGDLEAAKRVADAQDTHAIVAERGKVYYDNGKPEAPWTDEQIAAWETSPLRDPKVRAGLKATNEAMTAAIFGGPRRVSPRRRVRKAAR